MGFLSFYRICFRGLSFQLKEIYNFILFFYLKSSLSDRLQIIGAALGVLSILTSWSGYKLEFTEKHTYYHFIYTDDFLLYFIFFSSIAISVLLSRYWDVYILKAINILSTILVCVLALRQFFTMHTLIPVAIAELNLGFFVFIIALLLNGAGLALGIIAKPRAP